MRLFRFINPQRLLRAALFVLSTANASLLESPVVKWSIPSVDGHTMLRGNGFAITANNAHAYATTSDGALLHLDLRVDSAPVTKVMHTAPDGSVCEGGVALLAPDDQYAIYTYNNQVSVTAAEASSIVVVPLGADGEGIPDRSVQVIPLEGRVRGTPIVSGNFVFVVHSLENLAGGGLRRGRLSIYEWSASGDLLQRVETLPPVLQANAVGPLAQPAWQRRTLNDGTEVDWLVIAEARGDGLSREGNLYGVRWNGQSGLWHLLASNVGSTPTSPVVSADATTIAMGGARATITAFVQNQALANVVEANTPQQLFQRADVSRRLTQSNQRQNEPLTVRPLLFEDEKFIMTPDLPNSFSVISQDRGRVTYTIDTLSPHFAQPIQIDDSLFFAVDIQGILRLVSVGANAGEILYLADCQGELVEETEGGSCPLVLADMAMTSHGNVILYGSTDGSVTGVQVANFPTPPPSVAPSTPFPTSVPTAAPTASPTQMPTFPAPTEVPTPFPTFRPTPVTPDPTEVPTPAPTGAPFTLIRPISAPTAVPTVEPTEPIAIEPTPTGAAGGVGGIEGGSSQSNADEDGGSILDVLPMILGAVAGALFVAILIALFAIRRRKKQDLEEEKRIKNEVENLKQWKVSKEKYEEECRQEEEQTLNELGTPGSDDGAATGGTVTSSVVKGGRKQGRRHRRTNSKQASVGTLDSISESVDESEARGVEVELDRVESGSVAGDSFFSMSSSDHELSSNGDASFLGKQVTTAGTNPIERALATLRNGGGKTVEPTANPNRQPEPVKANRSIVIDGPTIETPETTKAVDVAHRSAPAQVDVDVEDPPVIASPARPSDPPTYFNPTSKPDAIPQEEEPAPLDDSYGDEPGAIKSGQRLQINQIERQRKMDKLNGITHPTSNPTSNPAHIPDPSDLMSVDSSLYLEGSTVSPHGSPKGTYSFGPSSHAGQSQTGRVPRRLSPPGGASIMTGAVSALTPRSAGDPDVDEFFESAPPAPSHYYIPDLSKANPDTRSSRTRGGAWKPPAVSPGARVTPRSSHSALAASPSRSYSPAQASPNHNRSPPHTTRARMPPTYEESSDPRGTTVYSESQRRRGRTKAGLFSRQQQRSPSLFDEASVSSGNQTDESATVEQNTSDEMAEDMHNTTRENYTRNDGRPRRGEDSRPRKEEESKHPRADMPIMDRVDETLDYISRQPKKGNTKSPSLWDSFMAELTKAEQTFFNPVMGSSESPPRKDQSSGQRSREYRRQAV